MRDEHWIPFLRTKYDTSRTDGSKRRRIDESAADCKQLGMLFAKFRNNLSEFLYNSLGENFWSFFSFHSIGHFSILWIKCASFAIANA
jgi:hypothetical protein